MSGLLNFLYKPLVIHGIAGTGAGLVSTLVGHPLDVIKTRLQVKHVSENPIHTVRNLIKNEGLRGLFDGAGTNVLASSINWGLFFILYNTLKGREGHRSMSRHLFAATLSSAAVTITTNPLFVVKTRLQLDGKRYNSMMHGLQTIAHQEGMRGLYSGLVPGLFGVSHGAVQFVVYEELKRLFRPSKIGMVTHLNMGEQFFVGAISKMIATAATYPYQVIRSRLQDSSNEYSGPMAVVKGIVGTEGVAGLYRGLIPQLIRVTPVAAVTFFTYERIARLMKPI